MKIFYILLILLNLLPSPSYGFLSGITTGGGGGGAVDSVNTKTGVVVLNAADVGAANVDLSTYVALAQGSWASGDLFYIWDLSTTTLKKTSVADFDGRYVLQSQIDTDNTLSTDSDTRVASQKAAKKYADDKVQDQITNNITTIAPSQNVVFDSLAVKADKDFSILTSLGQSSFQVADILAIYDVSASQLKQATIADFDERYVRPSTIFPLSAPADGSKAYGFAGGDNDTYMGSTGDGNISYYANGFLRMHVDQNETTVEGPLIITGNISANNYPPTGSTNTLAYFDNSGDLAAFPNWTRNGVGGIDYFLTLPIGDTGGFNIDNVNHNIEPTEDSPTVSMGGRNWVVNFDNASSGFSTGDGGQAWNWLGLGITHHGTGNIGSSGFIRMVHDLGNGVDPIEVGGLYNLLIQSNIHAGVTITGQTQGYGIQMNTDADTILEQEHISFFDFNNFAGEVPGYTIFNANPNIAKISNNRNFNILINNSNIGEMVGNAGINGLSFRPRVTTMGTGHFQMIDIRPELLSGTSDNNTLMNIDVSQIPGTNNRAAQFTGPVDVQGPFTFTGAISLGKTLAYYNQNVADGGGNPTSVHQIISSITIPDNDTTANADTIGINGAMLVGVGANSAITLGPFGLFSAMALPVVVETQTGSTLPRMQGGTFAISFSSSSTGGNIDQVEAARFVMIPAFGGTPPTVGKAIDALIEFPFGCPATYCYGLYSKDPVNNYVEGTMRVGGSTSDDRITKSHYGLEVDYTVGAGEGFQLDTSTAQPTCDIDHRGLIWSVEGGTGVDDSVQVCVKNSLDSYVWKSTTLI